MKLFLAILLVSILCVSQINCIVNGVNTPHKTYNVYIDYIAGNRLPKTAGGTLVSNNRVLTSKSVVIQHSLIKLTGCFGLNT